MANLVKTITLLFALSGALGCEASDDMIREPAAAGDGDGDATDTGGDCLPGKEGCPCVSVDQDSPAVYCYPPLVCDDLGLCREG